MSTQASRTSLSRDLVSSLVVFFVALPLCLGIALASGAPLFSGIVSGIVGGIVVGSLSGSHTSVSGPAASLTAIIFTQIGVLGSFEALLLAVVVAGVLQIGLGLVRTGMLARFVPVSVITGLLAAIGVILVLKQIPHILGHDSDPEGEMAFEQPDSETTFSELLHLANDIHVGAAVIGLLSLALLVGWTRVPWLKKSGVPAQLAIVILGLGLQVLFDHLGETFSIGASHLVQVPVVELSHALELLRTPDFSQWANLDVYTTGVTIALVASVATLLNLEAVDKLDAQQRTSPPNRELLAQGIGNVVCGLTGGLPMTSVIIRGSVNIDAGATTKRSAVFPGALLLVSVLPLPQLLNRIPLSCLAAILLVTGFKLASPAVIRKMWDCGWEQFVPFLVTMLAIVFTDLLVGLRIGLAVSGTFVLSRLARQPLRRIAEKHIDGEVLHIELPELTTFLTKAKLEQTLEGVPEGGRVLLDASSSTYIDPEILAVLREYRDVTAPARRIQFSMKGFHESYAIEDDLLIVDYSSRELQERLTHQQVVQILREGNERFCSGRRLNRDLAHQLGDVLSHHHPLAVVLSCSDARAPVELVFDVGLGDVFSLRVSGNVLTPELLGSMEYGCEVASARVVVVMGHTACAAIAAAVDLHHTGASARESTGCQHLDGVLDKLEPVIVLPPDEAPSSWSPERKEAIVNEVVRANVLAVIRQIPAQSSTMRELLDTGRVAIVGVVYDIHTGRAEFLLDSMG